jgi:hypothetical protein
MAVKGKVRVEMVAVPSLVLVAAVALATSVASEPRAVTDDRPIPAPLPGDKPVLALEGHPDGAPFAAFTDSGKTIITADYMGMVRICDAGTGRVRRSFKTTASCMRFALARDGQTLAIGGMKQLALYEMKSGRALWKDSWPDRSGDWCHGVAFTSDGNRIISGDDICIRVWEVASGKKKSEEYLYKGMDAGLIVDDRLVTELAVGPDCRTLAFGARRHTLPGDPTKPRTVRSDELIGSLTLRLRDLDNGREVELASKIIGKNKMWNPMFFVLAFTPDGRLLAAAAQAGHQDPEGHFPTAIQVWDVATQRELPPFGGPQTGLAAAKGLAFSPDGRNLFSVSWDGTIRLWEMATGKVRRRLEVGKGKIGGAFVTFTPDGKRFLSGVGQPRLWDVMAPASQEAGKKQAPTTQEIKAIWSHLAGEDAEQAYRSACELLACPEQSVPFLDKEIRSSAATAAPNVEKLMSELDNEKFAARERATKELTRLGHMARPALRKALAGQPSPEARRRMEALMAGGDSLIHSPDAVRIVRAVEALEHIGTPDARKVLQELVKDLPHTWAAEHAKLAFERMEERR